MSISQVDHVTSLILYQIIPSADTAWCEYNLVIAMAQGLKYALQKFENALFTWFREILFLGSARDFLE